MPTLKKPTKCKCGSKDLKYDKNPERWDCNRCNTTVVSRRSLVEARKCCRVCKKGPPEVTMAPRTQANGIICEECLKIKKNRSLKTWRKKPGTLRRLHQKERQNAQTSAERFIAYVVALKGRLQRHLVKKKPKRRRALFAIGFTTDDILALYKKQRGKCAISGMVMTHAFDDLRTLSIDRIESDKGYTLDNVQLVCQWVNMAKGKHSDSEMKAVLCEFKRG